MILDMQAPEVKQTRRIVQHFEASDHCHLDSYIVPGEEHLQATIAWGRAISLSSHPKHTSQSQADIWLVEDIALRFELLVKHIPAAVFARLSPGQKAAFISWAYNGKGWFNSDTFKLLQAGKIDEFFEHAALWYHGEHGVVLPGLVRRRAVELHISKRGEFDRVITSLKFYTDLPAAVNAGLKHGMKHGSLKWNTDRLIWSPAA